MTIKKVELYRNNCAFFTRNILITAPERAQLFFHKVFIERVIQTLRVTYASVDQSSINVVYESGDSAMKLQKNISSYPQTNDWLAFAKCFIGAKVEI